jgi:phosphoribosylamine--glycine ligase
MVFHAGTARKDGSVVTNGGRVLGVTAVDGDVLRAIEKAYAAVRRIKFAGAHYRKDIAHRVMARFKK